MPFNESHFLRACASITIALLCTLSSAQAWSQPHNAITKAALETLPEWQKTLLGEELTPLAEDYCLIPDHVFSDPAVAKFAMRDDKPKEIYRLNLHLPAQQAENLETLRYFFEKAVSSIGNKHIKDAARYMGTVCHQIEDYGSPSHTMPGDNMFTLLQQFLPPPETMRDVLLHGPVESGTLLIAISGYKPRLLGTNVDEAAWRLMHRIHEGILNARSTTIPIIQALYAGNSKRVEEQQLMAAKVDAEIVADAIFTMLSIGHDTERQLNDSADGVALHHTSIGAFFPTEAVSLYYAQSQFFSSPYWGHARSGVILVEGKRAVPLKLKIARDGSELEQTFTNGISAGMGKPLTFLLPRGVYARFSVFAGLHPELGTEGKVQFTILGDGKELATATVSGKEPAQSLECDLKGVSELQLSLQSKGGEPKSNYA
jgi:NPCBM/NEW2 domain